MKTVKRQQTQEREDRTAQDTIYLVLGIMFVVFGVITQFAGGCAP